MSHRRKHVTSKANESCPLIKDNEKILRVSGVRGSNLVEARLGCAAVVEEIPQHSSHSAARHQPSTLSSRNLRPSNRRTRSCRLQVDDAEGATFLVRMPQKFVKVLWVKKGALSRVYTYHCRQLLM